MSRGPYFDAMDVLRSINFDMDFMSTTIDSISYRYGPIPAP